MDRIEAEFAKATAHRISDFFKFKEGELVEFLQNRSKMFQVEDAPGRKTKVVMPLEYFVTAEFKLSEVPWEKVLSQYTEYIKLFLSQDW